MIIVFKCHLGIFSETADIEHQNSPGGSMVETSPSNAGDVGSVSGQGTEIPPTLQPKNQNVRQRQYCNEFSKDFKNGPHQKILILEKNNKYRASRAGGDPWWAVSSCCLLSTPISWSWLPCTDTLSSASWKSTPLTEWNGNGRK